MCAIFGALIHSTFKVCDADKADETIAHIMKESQSRGRDGFGWQSTFRRNGPPRVLSYRSTKRNEYSTVNRPMLSGVGAVSGVFNRSCVLIGNFRAEPTTEYVEVKGNYDQQPYQLDEWSIVHNGTIANDKELRTNILDTTIDSAAIVEALNFEPEQMFTSVEDVYAQFRTVIEKLVGSYAILATHKAHPDAVFVAANYRPIWYAELDAGVFFASAKEYFPKHCTPVALEPYSTGLFKVAQGAVTLQSDTLQVPDPEKRPRALVVASGGLDSTVAAQKCIKDGYDVSLIHFTYGCRAEGEEVDSVFGVAKAMGVPVKLFPMDIYENTDSRLFDKDCEVAGGEAGAEFAHEWVPARNLVMLSVATAYAEANGFDYIVLGNNLEEAGAYPDNEPEFIRRFNDLLPFAVGADKRVRVLMPVGDLMKHEIVSLGIAIGAPLDKTWSCYRSGSLHCGKCGPCFMRRTAFKINGIPEVITYEG